MQVILSEEEWVQFKILESKSIDLHNIHKELSEKYDCLVENYNKLEEYILNDNPYVYCNDKMQYCDYCPLYYI